MHNNCWGGGWSVSFCVCVYVSQSNHFVVWMCPGFICIWRWVHSRGWILRDLFCNPEPSDARASAFCLAQSANPSTSPAKSHQLLCFLLSRLFSHFLFLSQRLIQFLFTSLFLSAWLARTMLSHILFVLNGLWPSHSWVPVFLRCFFPPYFSLSFKHRCTWDLSTNSRRLGNSLAHCVEFCYTQGLRAHALTLYMPCMSEERMLSQMQPEMQLWCNRDELEAMGCDWQMRRGAVANSQESNQPQSSWKSQEIK